MTLQDHLNPHDADSTLRAVIGWGRYAELFTYDDRTQTFGLERVAGVAARRNARQTRFIAAAAAAKLP